MADSTSSAIHPKGDFFNLKKNGTDVRTEILAGLTTFFTMAYIIFVNPAILGDAKMDKGAVMLATCIAAGIGTLFSGLFSNYPLAQAPGMGLNAFFAYTICGTYGYSWQAGLAAVFISGVIFILITAGGIREKIVDAIPLPIKRAISGGIGLFIAIVSLKGAGIVAPSESTIITLGNFTAPSTALAIIGIFITVLLVVYKVKGGLFISIIATSVVGAVMQFGFGANVGIAKGLSTSGSLAPTFGQFLNGFPELLHTSEGVGVALFSLIAVLISLTMVDMFDTVGTLYGTAGKAGYLTPEGKLPNATRAMMADATATVIGSILGTSTVTTYVESSAGISEGGKTGLTSVTTSICFILAIFLAPFLGFIPGSATYPVLLIVGVMMIGGVRDVNWDDMETAIPCFLTIAMMPFAYSISEGIAFGCISYCFIKLVRGKAKEVSPIMYIIALLFIVRYILEYVHF
ncbi:MAG: NCS2 family permease [Oscillospiraceae bacterium]|jgi:AGZA family xanthine/uracil permease-like MFS transporter|nr:NCS2 family permease [Oscillospiraceae bacterium]